MIQTDVIIIGAGAAGLMCALEAGKRQRKVLVLEHANKPGKKILMSGGGRCNFTNYHIHPDNYLSHNPHFCKSALSRYSQWDFIALVKKHAIAFHEKKHGQLFCDNKSIEILNMLLAECHAHGVDIHLKESIHTIEKNAEYFIVNSNKNQYQCGSLVIATGGLSIPTMGATPFGYQIASQFNIPVHPTRAGLVPLTLHPEEKAQLAELAGISHECVVSFQKQSFRENILFTHRGLSGPAILQISSYWQSGKAIYINFFPQGKVLENFISLQKKQPNLSLREFFSRILTRKTAQVFLNEKLAMQPLQAISHQLFQEILAKFLHWQIKPNGTEGYRTAEVTLGGVDCDAISSKTMEANKVRGLYFIGEVLDVTGWLGGYNFQWAWSCGWAAGQYV